MLSYFQDHYVKAAIIDEWYDFYVVLNILQKINTRFILRQWLEFVLVVREMSGKSQGFFFSANLVATLIKQNMSLVQIYGSLRFNWPKLYTVLTDTPVTYINP